MFKCSGVNVTEVGPTKTPMFTAVLTPTEGEATPGSQIRLVGGAGTIVASLVYGKIYALTEVEAPTE